MAGAELDLDLAPALAEAREELAAFCGETALVDRERSIRAELDAFERHALEHSIAREAALDRLLVAHGAQRLTLDVDGMPAVAREAQERRRAREGRAVLQGAHVAIEQLHERVSICLVGKYTHLRDSYISVTKSLNHAALACGLKLELQWVEATDLEEAAKLEAPLKYHEAWRVLCAAQ